ncbi:MAG: PDDEXK nuclease domain-containing protein [Bacteroidota bacterium]
MQQESKRWGSAFLENLAKDLLAEFPGIKGFSFSNLKYIRRWYQLYAPLLVSNTAAPIWPQLGAKLQSADIQSIAVISQGEGSLESEDLINVPWGHHKVILDKVKVPAELAFYLRMTVKNGWSRNVLEYQISTGLAKRQGTAVTNFPRLLPAKDSELAVQTLKNPYMFDFLTLGPEAKERDLENAMITHISKFLLELGRGFAYVGRQLHLDVDGDAYFPDLIFFHTKLKRYVVFELKMGKFQSEYIAKLGLYCEVINRQVKEEGYEPTIGVLLCQTPNKLTMEIALKNSNQPIGVAEYEFAEVLPADIKGELPTIEEMETELVEAQQEIQPEWKKKLESLKKKTADQDTLLYKRDEVPFEYIQHDMELAANSIWEMGQEFKDLFLEMRMEITERSQVHGYYGRGMHTFYSLHPIELEQNVRNIRSMELRFSGLKSVLMRTHTEYVPFQISFGDTFYSISYNNSRIVKPYHHRLTEDEIKSIVNQAADDLIENLSAIK